MLHFITFILIISINQNFDILSIIKGYNLRYIFLLSLLITLSFGDINAINSFEADFKQDVTNDKGNVLSYSGHIKAIKPQNALWSYQTPIKKEIYVTAYKVVIVEPEIEQAIVKVIQNDFDFFSMIKNAKEIKKDIYIATFKESKFTIKLKNKKIKSIAYIDEFDNSVLITFTKQTQNRDIDAKIFQVSIPMEYDIIRD